MSHPNIRRRTEISEDIESRYRELAALCREAAALYERAMSGRDGYLERAQALEDAAELEAFCR